MVRTIQVDLDKWTVSMLRTELGKKTNCSPDTLNVIVLVEFLSTNWLIQSSATLVLSSIPKY